MLYFVVCNIKGVIMNLIEKTYKKNKKIFHPGKPFELHHIFSRYGIHRCCPILWAFLTKNEHNNYRFTKILREQKRMWKAMVENNYFRNIGCRERIHTDCLKCTMPIMKEYKK